MTPELARLMASYNRWMNERLYGLCGQMSEAELMRDRGAFFKSIHGTLNHLLLSDKLWLGRFQGRPFRAKRLDEPLCEDFAGLQAQRRTIDDRIDQWATGLTDEALSGRLHYESMVSPAPRTCDMRVAVAHFFNHQTHHRGQLTTLLSQCDKDYGVTDLIWLPELRP